VSESLRSAESSTGRMGTMGGEVEGGVGRSMGDAEGVCCVLEEGCCCLLADLVDEERETVFGEEEEDE
jgi:hypothetical protein